jgi:hypothetical protein
MEQENYFIKLSKIDVSEHLEKKGQFKYLSWAWAVKALRQHYPTATWEVIRFDGLPYQKTELGYFVEVAVTVEGITLSQIHPVLDQRNKPIAQPTSFDINTSIQRALVKAIALHGLGIWVYAGEDLPEGSEGHTEAPAQDIPPATLKAKYQAFKGSLDGFEDWVEVQQAKNRNYKEMETLLAKGLLEKAKQIKEANA